MTADDDDSFEHDVEYNSGPFCRHYSDLDDCKEVCDNCKHTCTQHDYDGDCYQSVNGCVCPGWKEQE